MPNIKTDKELFYSLGGVKDTNNYSSSFFNPTGTTCEVPGNFARVENFEYDQVSLKILEAIGYKGKIRPQNIELSGIKISGEAYGNEVFLFRKDNQDGFLAFIQNGLSIIVDKTILQEMGRNIVNEKRSYNLIPISVRVKGTVPKKYLKAIAMPITLEAPLWNFTSKDAYITRRCEEIDIIHGMLKSDGIDIPICDTFTGEILTPSFEKVKKLSKAFIQK